MDAGRLQGYIIHYLIIDVFLCVSFQNILEYQRMQSRMGRQRLLLRLLTNLHVFSTVFGHQEQLI